MTGREKNSSEPLVVGIDLGGTNMQIGVVDARHAIVGHDRRKTHADQGPAAVIDNLVEGVHAACAAAGAALSDIAGVGIAAAGAIDIPRGIILNAPNLGWLNLPLRALLEEKLARPVVLENDVNGAVWGEHQLGAARGQGDVIGVWIGTGVGGGLVLGGKIYHGEFFTAGEIGHTIIDASEPWGRSKVEEVCSRTGMSRMIMSRLHAYPGSMMHELVDPEKGITGSKKLARGYAAGDALAVEVVHHAADMLGIAIANGVTLLAVDSVVLGGGVTEALGEPWVKRIRASFDRFVFPERSRQAKFFVTELRDNAGLLGAALLARASVGWHK